MKRESRLPLPRGALFVGSALAMTACAADAHATPDFPAVVQQVVGAASPPACTICHNNPKGGLGTVTTTFGVYMRSRGLVAFDENSLQTALKADQGEQHVSNSEGLADITALREGLDPNDPTGGTSDAPPPPQYGCGASIAPGRPQQGPCDVLALVIGAGVALRRRRSNVQRGWGRSPPDDPTGLRDAAAAVMKSGDGDEGCAAAALGLQEQGEVVRGCATSARPG